MMFHCTERINCVVNISLYFISQPITGDNTITWGDGTTTDAWGWYPDYPYTGSWQSTYTHIYLSVRKDPSSSETGLFNS